MLVHRLHTVRERSRDAALDELGQYVLELEGLDLDIKVKVSHLVQRSKKAALGWSFVMVNPDYFHEVLRACLTWDKRHRLAVDLWGYLFRVLPPDSNEVMATRAELAKELGATPRDISEVMTFLESLGAVMRERDGRGVRYFVNPRAGTHLGGGLRDEAQVKAPPIRVPPQLRLVEAL
jgi:hypothetical protein